MKSHYLPYAWAITIALALVLLVALVRFWIKSRRERVETSRHVPIDLRGGRRGEDGDSWSG